MTLMLCEQDATVQRLPDQLARHHGSADLGVQLLLDHLAQGGHGWRAADPRSCRRADGRGQRTDGAVLLWDVRLDVVEHFAAVLALDNVMMDDEDTTDVGDGSVKISNPLDGIEQE